MAVTQTARMHVYPFFNPVDQPLKSNQTPCRTSNIASLVHGIFHSLVTIPQKENGDFSLNVSTIQTIAFTLNSFVKVEIKMKL